jgi:hypothetical protein
MFTTFDHLQFMRIVRERIDIHELFFFFFSQLMSMNGMKSDEMTDEGKRGADIV